MIGLGWVDLADQMGYSKRTCQKLFDHALESIEKELKRMRGDHEI